MGTERKGRLVRIGVATIGVLLLAGAASATFVVQAMGDPEPSGSWRQMFSLYGDTYGEVFNHIEVHMDPVALHPAYIQGDTDNLKAPTGIADFIGGNGDWAQTSEAPLAAPTMVAADGTSASYLAFALHFPEAAPAASDNMGFQIYAWDNGNQVAHVDVDWFAPPTGGVGKGQWVITPRGLDGLLPVPEPVSMVMLGCVGAGMMAARRMKRKTVS